MAKRKRNRTQLDLPGSKRHLKALLDFVAQEEGKTRSELVVEVLESYLQGKQLLTDLREPAVPLVGGKVALDHTGGMKPLFGKGSG